MADPIQVVLTWLNSIKIDPQYLKPDNFLLIILISATVITPLLVHYFEQRKIPILYFDGLWKSDSSQSSKIYFLKITRKKGNGRTEGVEAFLSIKNRFDMISTL
jgi:hypothetical protein